MALFMACFYFNIDAPFSYYTRSIEDCKSRNGPDPVFKKREMRCESAEYME